MAGTYIEIDGENMTIDRDGALGEGHITVSLGNGGTVTLSDAQQAGKLIEFTSSGALTSNATVNFTAKDGAHYVLKNSTTGDYTVTAKVTGQTGFVLASGKSAYCYCNGTDLVLADSDPLASLVGLIGAQVNLAMSDANYSMTYAEQLGGYLNVTGTLTADRTITLKDSTVRYYFLYNNGTGKTVTLKTSAGTGIAVPDNKKALLFCDGTNVVLADDIDYVMQAAGTALSNSNTETVLGSFSIPANAIGKGTVVRIRFQGIATLGNSTDTLTVRLRFGTTTLTGTALITTSAVDVTNGGGDIFTGFFELTSRAAAGAAAAIIGSGLYSDPAAVGGAFKTAYLGSTNFATNGALLVEVTGQWSVANAGNSCRLDQLNVEIR